MYKHMIFTSAKEVLFLPVSVHLFVSRTMRIV